MTEISISEMLVMQRELWEKYREKWSPLEPKYARDSLLWMVEEIGEVISIIKKRGEEAIINDTALRSEFITELADVLMYFNDTLMRYGITAAELSESYKVKHEYNMKRDFTRPEKA